MRISDWSSDVCSSDLHPCPVSPSALRGCPRPPPRPPHRSSHCLRCGGGRKGVSPRLRSEEHTSELQSLMRISYAVFCLKKQLTQTTIARRKTTMMQRTCKGQGYIK